MENNQITVSGKIIELEYSHECYNEKFYRIILETFRTSGIADYIPIIVSEKILVDQINEYVYVNGSIRTRNIDGHLDIFIFAEEIDYLNFDSDDRIDTNELELNGYICKCNKVRETPLKRVICDFIQAVNRPYGKSDYIPCIAWGRTARFVEKIEIGTPVVVYGRFQSRYYEKNGEQKIAYEISVQSIETK